MIGKKSIWLLAAGLMMALPAHGQKFSKRLEARKEARAANYFYGAQFTLAAGYVHSWMTTSAVRMNISQFGRSAQIKNTHDAFDIGFLYDQAFNRRWGLQTGLYYTQKGGEHMTYSDQGLGYGPILYDRYGLTVHGVELQALGRCFLPLAYDSRLSLGVGPYITKLIDVPDGFRNWDLGLMVSIGYDWRHWSASLSYQPGLNSGVVEHSDTRMNALSVNVGFRFWKK